MQKTVLALFVILAALFLTGCEPRINPIIKANESLRIASSLADNHSITEMNAQQIINKLKDYGLPIGHVIVYDEETDENRLLGRPYQYTSKVNFADTRIEQRDEIKKPIGGSIEVFDNREDALMRKEYIESIVSSINEYSQKLYLYENVLLRIDQELSASQAAEYDFTIQAIRSLN